MRTAKKVRTTTMRYGIGLLAFAVPMAIIGILHYYSINVSQTVLVVAALIVAAWFGGTGPGLIVAVLFELVAIRWTTQRPASNVAFLVAEVNRFALLVILVVLVRTRKKAEARLRDQREWLQVTLASIGDAVIATGLDGKITFINPAAETLTGWTTKQAMGRPAAEVCHIYNKDSHCESEGLASNLVAIGPHTSPPSDVILTTRDGLSKTLEYSRAPIRDRENEIDGSVLVFRDVTERDHLQDQLRQSQKMEAIGQLAGGIAHDFNNLLTIIVGYSSLLSNQLGSNESLKAEVEEIRAAAKRAGILTSQLLAFSRRQLLQPVVLDPNEVVLDVEQMLRRLIGENIEIVTIARARLGHIKADRGQLEQVIMNLVVNARDAMPRGGKLTIETANVELYESYARSHAEVTPGPYVLLAISDSGHGMDSETQARVFEPFFTTKGMGKGTGLGLATVYGIVKQSGGHIWLYSEPEKGTTFKVYFPRVDEPVDAAQVEGFSAEALGGTQTLLLTEDDNAVRAFARTALENFGYSVLEAASGPEAIEIIKQSPRIAMLITDVVMPQMSGRELALEVLRLAPSTPVLYLSGYTENAIQHHGVLDEGVEFLQKPFTPESLARKVSEVLNGNHAEGKLEANL